MDNLRNQIIQDGTDRSKTAEVTDKSQLSVKDLDGGLGTEALLTCILTELKAIRLLVSLGQDVEINDSEV